MLAKYDGSISSFSQLLESGDISKALQLRLEAIEAVARHYRQDVEAAKVSSAALGVVGLLMSASPLIAILAGCGLAGYGYVVLRDFQITKKLCPLPLLRKESGELLIGVGMAAVNPDPEPDDPLINVIGYLEPELAHEYELVMVAQAQLTGYLANLPGEKRLLAYRHILRHTRLRNSLQLPSLQEITTAVAHSTVGVQPEPLPEPDPGTSEGASPPEPTAETHTTIDVDASPVESADQATSVANVAPTRGSDSTPTEPQSNIQPQEPTQKPPLSLETFQAIGNQAIDDLAYTSQSIIFLGTPGAGKTTSLGVMLGRLRSNHGDRLKLYAIAMKNDSFGGATVGQLNVDSDACWAILLVVVTELRLRATLPKSGREAYCQANPIKLILDDYVSQQRQYDTVLKDKKVEYPEASGAVNIVRFGDAVDAVLSEIVFNGRELGVSCVVSTHSSNIDDLPFLSSKSGRASVILMIQAMKNLLKRQGTYEIVSQSINNCQLIAAEEDRRRLKEIFPVAKELSLHNQQPLLLTSNSDAGEYTLGIVPNLVAEYEEYERMYSSTIEDEALSATSDKPNDSHPTQLTINSGNERIDDLSWNQMILGMSEEEINNLIEQRRSKSVSPSLDVPDTPDTPTDTGQEGVSNPGTEEIQGLDGSDDTTDTEPDMADADTYQAENFAQDFPEWTEQEMFTRIRDTTLPPGRFIKEDLKFTNNNRNKKARKAVGYLVRKYGDFRLMEKFKDYL
jgi:hypothetical protein